jgi:hypothetical protein
MFLIGTGFSPSGNTAGRIGALEAAEKLTFLSFGGSRGLQPPE